MNDQSANHRPDEPITFHCNICGAFNESGLSQLTRENPSCTCCGSSVRMRSIVQILTTELFGCSLSIAEIRPKHKEITGVGMSCWDGYAIPLASCLGYTNTFYHQTPLLDITRIDAAMEGTLDFLISTDVFEHIEPPVSRAFVNARKLLKPGGVFVFSVPFSHPDEQAIPTQEHFPELHDYTIAKNGGGGYRLKNTTRQGEVQYFDDLIFHGGAGSTLEMRVFSQASILAEMKDAGFSEVEIYDGSDLRHGIYWPHPWSVPMVARVNMKTSTTYPRINIKTRPEMENSRPIASLSLIRRITRKILRHRY